MALHNLQEINKIFKMAASVGLLEVNILILGLLHRSYFTLSCRHFLIVNQLDGGQSNLIPYLQIIL